MFKCLKQSLHSNYQGTHRQTDTHTDTAFYSLGYGLGRTLTLAICFNNPSLCCLQTSLALTFPHLNDLLLHVDGVSDGGAIWPRLCVLPGLAASCQGQYLL